MKKISRAKSLPAREHMDVLFEQAKLQPERAKEYVKLARKIGMKTRIRLPVKWRRRVCRACNAFLTPGRNCRVRLHEKKVVYRCLECNGMMRFPYQRLK